MPELSKESIKRAPNPNAVAVLEKTITIQGMYNSKEVCTDCLCASLMRQLEKNLWRLVTTRNMSYQKKKEKKSNKIIKHHGTLY